VVIRLSVRLSVRLTVAHAVGTAIGVTVRLTVRSNAFLDSLSSERRSDSCRLTIGRDQVMCYILDKETFSLRLDVSAVPSEVNNFFL
jgi:hypothetical protein